MHQTVPLQYLVSLLLRSRFATRLKCRSNSSGILRSIASATATRVTARFRIVGIAVQLVTTGSRSSMQSLQPPRFSSPSKRLAFRPLRDVSLLSPAWRLASHHLQSFSFLVSIEASSFSSPSRRLASRPRRGILLLVPFEASRFLSPA